MSSSQEQRDRVAERLAAKRAAVLRPRRGVGRFVLPGAAALVVVGVAIAVVARMLPEDGAGPAAGAMFGYVPQSGEVTHPRSDFDGQSARFYQHKAGEGVIVRYFVHLDGDGTARAALDACAECWREGRGHHQDGGEMVCAQCDKRFEIAALGEVRDPCVPIPLPVTVGDEQVSVPIPDLLEAAKYFKNPYRSL